MYVNGSGFRAIANVKGVHHTTVMGWVREVGELLPNAYEPERVPEVGECDELQTYVGSKKQALALDGCRPLPGWDTRLGFRRPKLGDIPSGLGASSALEVLLLGQ